MLYVLILFTSGGNYSLKSIPNDRLFWETFHGNFIYFQSFFCQKSFLILHFDWVVWPGVWNVGLMSNKSTHCLLEYGYFNHPHHFIKTRIVSKSANGQTYCPKNYGCPRTLCLGLILQYNEQEDVSPSSLPI